MCACYPCCRSVVGDVASFGCDKSSLTPQCISDGLAHVCCVKSDAIAIFYFAFALSLANLSKK